MVSALSVRRSPLAFLSIPTIKQPAYCTRNIPKPTRHPLRIPPSSLRRSTKRALQLLRHQLILQRNLHPTLLSNPTLRLPNDRIPDQEIRPGQRRKSRRAALDLGRQTQCGREPLGPQEDEARYRCQAGGEGDSGRQGCYLCPEGARYALYTPSYLSLPTLPSPPRVPMRFNPPPTNRPPQNRSLPLPRPSPTSIPHPPRLLQHAQPSLRPRNLPELAVFTRGNGGSAECIWEEDGEGRDREGGVGAIEGVG